MKKNLLKTVIGSLFLGAVLFASYSCSDDGLTERDVNNILDSQWQIVPSIIIKSTDWQVEENKKERYYYCTVELPQLNGNIFDEGAVLAYYKYDNDNKTTLPFVKTKIGEDGIPYTESYGCDFGVGTVTFTFEASDAGQYDVLPTAEFQIVLIY